MIVGLTTCKTAKMEKSPPFTITQATYNHWVGGQEGVSGVKVTIAYTAPEDVIFKSIFFHNKEAKIENRNVGEKKYIIGHFNTSTRARRDIILDRDPKKEMNNKLPEKKNTF